MTPDETLDVQFNEEEWNNNRVALENAAITAILDVSDFMGCNSFSFVHAGNRIKIVIEG